MMNQQSAPRYPIWQLLCYLRSRLGQLIFAMIASIANKVLDLMPPILVGWIIASISRQPPHWITFFVDSTSPMSMAIFLTILAIFIFGFESLTQWLYSLGFMNLAQHMQHELRLETYRHIQGREMAFFERHRVGETMAMLNDDINQLERFLNNGFNDILQLITLVIFAGLVLFSLSWQLALIGMIPAPFIIWGSLIFQSRIAPRYRRVREAVADLSSRLENNLGGMMVIKSFTAEQFESARVAEASANYRTKNFHAIKLSTIFIPIIRMSIAIGFGGVLLFGSYWVLTGQHGLTVATLVVFSMMIQRLLWPFTRLGTTLDEYQRARASATRTFSLLTSVATITDPQQPQHLSAPAKCVTFDRVGFYYDSRRPLLKDISLTVAANETVGIVGFSGAGKSTLIKCLLRFYDVTSGQILLDGIQIKSLTLQELRQQIALVSQDVYLFHGTVRENIAYGLENIESAAVEEAARLAHLDDFIRQLPEQYDTMIGERGVKLSGGQRQRLSIARAILKNAPIMVFDEATSSVDTETERVIQQNLAQLTQGKTALIIAHRLSTIRHVNRIIVLHQGSIVESGTHDELVRQQGYYADLWALQSGSQLAVSS